MKVIHFFLNFLYDFQDNQNIGFHMILFDIQEILQIIGDLVRLPGSIY